MKRIIQVAFTLILSISMLLAWSCNGGETQPTAVARTAAPLTVLIQGGVGYHSDQWTPSLKAVTALLPANPAHVNLLVADLGDIVTPQASVSQLCRILGSAVLCDLEGIDLSVKDSDHTFTTTISGNPLPQRAPCVDSNGDPMTCPDLPSKKAGTRRLNWFAPIEKLAHDKIPNPIPGVDFHFNTDLLQPTLSDLSIIVSRIQIDSGVFENHELETDSKGVSEFSFNGSTKRGALARVVEWQPATMNGKFVFHFANLAAPGSRTEGDLEVAAGATIQIYAGPLAGGNVEHFRNLYDLLKNPGDVTKLAIPTRVMPPIGDETCPPGCFGGECR